MDRKAENVFDEARRRVNCKALPGGFALRLGNATLGFGAATAGDGTPIRTVSILGPPYMERGPGEEMVSAPITHDETLVLMRELADMLDGWPGHWPAGCPKDAPW